MENREICEGRRRRTVEESLLADLTRKTTRGSATTEAFPGPNLPIVSRMVKYADIKMVEIQSYLELELHFYGEKLRREHQSASRIQKKGLQQSLEGVGLTARKETLSWALMEDYIGANRHVFIESDFKGMNESRFKDLKLDFFFITKPKYPSTAKISDTLSTFGSTRCGNFMGNDGDGDSSSGV